MKKKIFSVLFALVLACSFSLVTAVPAAAQEGEVWVDDDWAGTTTGADPDGGGPATSFGTDAFATIQDGIDMVAEGGTVNVTAGEYDESVTIDKSLTLLGAQPGVDPRPSVGGRNGEEAVIDGGGSPPITVNADDVVINGFTMLNAGGKDGGCGCVWIEPERQHISVLYNALSDARYGVWVDDHCQHILVENNVISDCGRGVYARECSNDEVAPKITENDFYDNYRGIFVFHLHLGESQVVITDNYFEELTEGTTDYGIYGYSSSFLARGNKFVNIGTFYPDFYTYPSAICGLACTSPPVWDGQERNIKRSVIEDNVIIATKTVAIMGYFSDFLVRNNEITRLSSGYAAIWIKGGTGYDPSQEAYGEWTIENNDITGPGNSGNGIYGTGGGYGQSALSALGNTITGFENGVKLVNDGDIVAKATIQFNNITGNAFGISNVAANAEVDATNNWWGDASGPYHAAFNPEGLGNRVSDNVLFAPWLKAPYRPTTPMSSFIIDHAKVDFKKKADDDKVRVQGKLELDLVNGNGVDISEDVIVTVGPLSETVTMEQKGKKDDRWHYQRLKGDEGNIKHMTINWKNGKFDIRMDKAELTGITNPVTISIQIGDDVGEESITMREKKHHWDYKAK